MNPLIKRAFDAEMRAAGTEESIIEGHPIVYGSATDICGWFAEIIEPGALDEADLTDVRLCKNHDTSNVYARSKKGAENSTMTLTPDESGLHISASLDTENNPLAAAYYSEVQRGDISGMSFMFSVAEETWSNLESDYPTRHITKIGSVVEVSGVTFPAYEATDISARNEQAAEAARSAVEAARSASDDYKAEADKLALEKEKIKLITI